MARDREAEEREAASQQEIKPTGADLLSDDLEERMNFWRLCDELSVVQAAALLVGVDPSSEIGAQCDNWSAHLQPKGYAAAKAAMVHAINGGRLTATIRHSAREHGWATPPSNAEGEVGALAAAPEPALDDSERLSDGAKFAFQSAPDWSLTTIEVDSLKWWLSKRGFETGFFFKRKRASPDYLNPRHARYAPKLAAALRAWMAVDDPKGKHPKQALAKWLRENSAEFGLSDEDGKPNEQGIDECAKVANWQPGGGAPRTGHS